MLNKQTKCDAQDCTFLINCSNIVMFWLDSHADHGLIFFRQAAKQQPILSNAYISACLSYYNRSPGLNPGPSNLKLKG